MVILILYMLLMDFQQMQIISGLLTRMTSRLLQFWKMLLTTQYGNRGSNGVILITTKDLALVKLKSI
jgi:hypothetical protein